KSRFRSRGKVQEKVARVLCDGEHRLPACSSRQLAANRARVARSLDVVRRGIRRGRRMQQAGGLCSPETKRARYPEFAVAAGTAGRDGGPATGKWRVRNSSTLGNSSRLRRPK